MSGQSIRPIGAHMPVAGGLASAITSGAEIGCTAVQLFTANPRQWQAPDLADEAIAQFRESVRATEMAFVVAHDSYLINLAAPDPKILSASRRAFRGEIERAEALGIPWVVTHMGAHIDSGVDTGLSVLAESITRLLQETAGMKAGIALETTAGQGSSLGNDFGHLTRVLDAVGATSRIGVCFDTCHAFAAGYDVSNAPALSAVFDALDDAAGLGLVKVIHCNDAKKPLGSRVDRHEHLGDGHIGLEAFGALVREPRVAGVPLILETPEAEKMHATNLDRLRQLVDEAR